MAGTVFLSCGQNDQELQIAKKIEDLLSGAPFNLSVFVARATNNLHSLNNDVLDRLAYADYFVFVNFHSATEGGFAGSLYSHQELAMALALGHRQLLIFSETDAPKMGIIQSMHLNRPCFSSEEELLEQIRKDIQREKWRVDYSRFLRAREVVSRANVNFGDGVGNVFNGTAISVVVENQSNELHEGVIVTLEKLDGKEPEYQFRSPVKVSGQRRYDAAIPPEFSVNFDIVMDGNRMQPEPTASGVFLVSALDLVPLPALFSDKRQHEMEFRLDARDTSPFGSSWFAPVVNTHWLRACSRADFNPKQAKMQTTTRLL